MDIFDKHKLNRRGTKVPKGFGNQHVNNCIMKKKNYVAYQIGRINLCL